MLVSVLPLKHSLSTKAFTYSISETWADDIQVGSLVEIPIGKHLDLGVVSEIFREENIPDENYEIKPILAIIASIALLTPEMIHAIEKISKTYFLPIHKIVSLFLPAPLLSRLDKKNYLLERPLFSEKKSDPVREIHHFVGSVFSPKDMDDYMTDGSIFAFPDDLFALSFFDDKKGNIELLLNESTPTKKSQLWLDMYEKKTGIIIWTRRILYYNLEAYDRIYYIEDSFGSEHFQYPTRIRTLDILRALADTLKKDIIIITSSPTLTLLADFRDFKIINKNA